MLFRLYYILSTISIENRIFSHKKVAQAEKRINETFLIALNCSMFKIKTHNAYIIMKIPKESYIKEKESLRFYKNRYDS